MGKVIRLGISPCPNDTFAFHGLMERRVDWHSLDFRVELMDVQALNQTLSGDRFDVVKASFYAALRSSQSVGVLPSGSALGFGVGPVLLAAEGRSHPGVLIDGRPARVLCPGEWTTATLLYQAFHPGHGTVDQVAFSEIMPALQRGAADFGVCIHEGRFTFRKHGLSLVEDLGTTWELATAAPLPLGGIMARLDLGEEMLAAIQATIRDSLEYGRDHPEETLPTMRRHAQELDDDVIRAHVDLYVNEWTSDLGEEGRRAIALLAERARQTGLLSPSQPALRLVRC